MKAFRYLLICVIALISFSCSEEPIMTTDDDPVVTPPPPKPRPTYQIPADSIN